MGDRGNRRGCRATIAWILAAAFLAGCAPRAVEPVAGPAPPRKGSGSGRVASAPRVAAAPEPPLPDSFDALRAESLALATETRLRHGDSAVTIDLEASMRARFGDLAAAADLWEDWLVDHPDTPEAHVWLGKLARERGDDATAIGHFRTAFDARPDIPGAQVLLGATLVSAGRGEEAERVLVRELPGTAGNPNRSILLGHARLQSGDAAGAKEAFARAVALAPGSAHAIYGLAGAVARLGDKAESKRLLAEFSARKEKALESDREHADERLDDLPALLPVVARWYAAAGRIEALHGDPVAAEARWRRAIRFDPAQREAVAELERAWRRQGRHAEADRLVEHAAGAAARGGASTEE